MRSHLAPPLCVLVLVSFTQAQHDDRAALAAAFAEARHAIRAVDGAHAAFNPGQRWCVAFDGRGVDVVPADGAWSWGLELESWGVAGREVPARGRAAAHAEGARLVHSWSEALEEWYVNDGRGLEHGYTVTARPPGDADAVLRFVLAVRGGLEPRVHGGLRGVDFIDDQGVVRLVYSGLVVFDADNRELPARLGARDGKLLVEIDDGGARYPVTVDPIAQQAFLKASNTEAGDVFGSSVAIHGDTAVIGAPREDSAAVGINGNENDNTAADGGAAYVFVRTGGVWTPQAYLKASNTEADDRFGESVAIYGDTIVVGAPLEDSSATGIDGNQADNAAFSAGAAYVFVRSGTTWTQQAYLKESDTTASDRFGGAVAVSGDTVVVGAPLKNYVLPSGTQVGFGRVYVFVRSGVSWSEQDAIWAIAQSNVSGSLFSNQRQFGYSVAIEGDTMVVGAWLENRVECVPFMGGITKMVTATSIGYAYIFERSVTTWLATQRVEASNADDHDRFGGSVAISGDRIVIGAEREDSSSTGVNGNQADNGAADSGAAYVFERSGGTWIQEAYLKASNTDAGDEFGNAVAMSADTIVVGAFAEDGSATGVNGNDADNSAVSAGAAYLFVRNGAAWAQEVYLKSSNAEFGDLFGAAVAIDGDTVLQDTILVGARTEFSAATGVNGNQADNSAPAAGAAYVFDAQPSYPGTLEDLETDFDQNATGSLLLLAAVTPTIQLAPGDSLAIRHFSPDGTFAATGDYVALGSAVTTGSVFPTLLPGVHLELMTAFFADGGQDVFGLPVHLPHAGSTYGFTYPGGLAGITVLLQGFVSVNTATNGIFASTHGLEIRLL